MRVAATTLSELRKELADGDLGEADASADPQPPFPVEGLAKDCAGTLDEGLPPPPRRRSMERLDLVDSDAATGEQPQKVSER